MRDAQIAESCGGQIEGETTTFASQKLLRLVKSKVSEWADAVALPQE